LSTQSSGIPRVKSQELGQCRICLEEDALSNLETPCGCTGTQRHAHKECIQKWVNEKHHTTCEICDQPYQGNYVVPPRPPPTAGEPLTLVSPMGNLYLTVDDERVAGQLLHDVYDEWDDHRQPTVSWCFSFVMLLMFMMILQSTMTVPGDGSGPGGSTPSPTPNPAADPSAAAAAAGSAAAGLLAGFSLFVVWLVSKLFLVVLPLLMVMRLAARAQEQAAEAAAAAAVGTVPGLDGSPQAGRGGVEVDRDHPLYTLITRLAAARAAAQARQLANSTAAAGGSSGADDAADVEMQQATREARSRLGRDPTFWAPASSAAPAPAPAPAPTAASSARVGDRGQESGEEQVEAAAAQRLASLRALMGAIRASALRGEVFGQQRQEGGSSTAPAAGSAGSSRHGMV